MTLDALLAQIKTQPDKIEFEDVIETINNNYLYSPSEFTNGRDNNIVVNQNGTNEGSCKIFSFAQLNALSKEQTLACFGKYFREDVLQHPDANDHANIRALMQYSLDDVIFKNNALKVK